jgi:hypothetical protein
LLFRVEDFSKMDRILKLVVEVRECHERTVPVVVAAVLVAVVVVEQAVVEVLENSNAACKHVHLLHVYTHVYYIVV